MSNSYFSFLFFTFLRFFLSFNTKYLAQSLASFQKFILLNKEFSLHTNIYTYIFLDFVIHWSYEYPKPLSLQT